MREPISGLIDLDHASTEPLHRQLTQRIKLAVLSGRLAAGARLPSSRALALELGISRNTALSALEQLKAEGYIEARPGSATRVCAVQPALFPRREQDQEARGFQHRIAGRWQAALNAHHRPSPDSPLPFRPGVPDVSAFPYDAWRASLRRAANRFDESAAGYRDTHGHSHFRHVLASHLAETRGVVASPEQIIVTSSARGAISLIGGALLEEGDHVWMEEPGYLAPKTVFQACGARLVPIPVDSHGLAPHLAADAPPPRLIYATPSHQYPTGVMMHLSRRLELLSLAVKANAYILEDDYDSEFQYSGRPIAALQGLDRAGCVLYVGTFSKSLVPGLRVGFAVVPAALADRLIQVHRNLAQLVPPVVQLAVADFIESGGFRAHVRRMRLLYASRLEAFVANTEKFSEGQLRALHPEGGLQTVVMSNEGLSDLCLARKLTQTGIDGQPLRDFHLSPEAASHRGILMGFAAWSEAQAKMVLQRSGQMP